MKAIEFVKKFGWDEVISELSKTQDSVVVMWLGSQSNDYALVKDLKRLVESHELVEKYKRGRGIRFRVRWGMYRYGDTQEFNDRLKQAIADVESCMEVSSESN